MFAILPIISFCFIYRFIRSRQKVFGEFKRAAFLIASIIWGVLIVISTEFLSIFQAVQFFNLIVFWLIVTILFILFTPSYEKNNQIISLWKVLTLLEKVIVSLSMIILFLNAVVAFLGCPNSWDALTYHMPRVMFWQQNHTVAHYPTAEFRQLFFQPWGAYAELHFQILSHNDYFAGMISWFSYVGCALGMSLIGYLLGASRFVQILMFYSVLTIPRVIVEGSGIRLDMIVAFWTVSLIAMNLLFVQTGRWVFIILLGLTLGLGVLTKGTMYPIAIPLMILFSYEIWRKVRFRKALVMIVVIGILALFLNSGFYWRNYQVAADPLGPASMREWGLCQNMTPMLIASNIIKNIFYQLGTPINSLNHQIESFVSTIHQWMGVDPLDLRSNCNRETILAVSVSTYEESVTNCLQVLMILIGGVGLLFTSWRDRRYDVIKIFLAICVSFVYVSSTIKWNEQLCRYLLATMVVSLPLVFLWIGSRFPRALIWFLVIALFATSVPYLFKNNLRRMVAKNKQTIFKTSRLERYFQNDVSLLLPYNKVVDDVLERGCYQVGLHVGFNSWEYPLWVIMQQKSRHDFRVEHISPDKISSRLPYPLGNFSPCAVIALDMVEDRFSYNNQIFVKDKDFDRFSIYIYRKGQSPK